MRAQCGNFLLQFFRQKWVVQETFGGVVQAVKEEVVGELLPSESHSQLMAEPSELLVKLPDGGCFLWIAGKMLLDLLI